jgi:hypothetical protein
MKWTPMVGRTGDRSVTLRALRLYSADVRPLRLCLPPSRGERDGGLAWIMIAFGDRHPNDRETRRVYARAHKRLRGHYPK